MTSGSAKKELFTPSVDAGKDLAAPAERARPSAKEMLRNLDLDALFGESENADELRAEIARAEQEGPERAAKLEAEVAEAAFTRLGTAIRVERQRLLDRLRSRLLADASATYGETVPLHERVKIDVEAQRVVGERLDANENEVLRSSLVAVVEEMTAAGREQLFEGRAGVLFAANLLESSGIAPDTVALFRENKSYLVAPDPERGTPLSAAERKERDEALVTNARIAERELFMAVLRTEPDRVPELLQRLRVQDALRGEIVGGAEEIDAGKSGGSQYLATLEGGAGYYKSTAANVEAAKDVRGGLGFRLGCPPESADVRVAVVDQLITALGYQEMTQPVVLREGPEGRGSMQAAAFGMKPLDGLRKDIPEVQQAFASAKGNKMKMEMAKAQFAERLAGVVDQRQLTLAAALHHAYGESDGNAGNLLVNADVLTANGSRLAIIDTANGLTSEPATRQEQLQDASADPLMSIAADSLSYANVTQLPVDVVERFGNFLGNPQLTKAMEASFVSLLGARGAKAWAATKARLTEMVATGGLVTKTQARMAAT